MCLFVTDVCRENPITIDDSDEEEDTESGQYWGSLRVLRVFLKLLLLLLCFVAILWIGEMIFLVVLVEYL